MPKVLNEAGRSARLAIAQRIIIARKDAGLSQKDISVALGITFQQVQKYENGKDRVAAERLSAIAQATGKPIGWFFGDGAAGGARFGDDTIDDTMRLLAGDRHCRRLFRAAALLASANARDALRALAELSHMLAAPHAQALVARAEVTAAASEVMVPATREAAE